MARSPAALIRLTLQLYGPDDDDVALSMKAPAAATRRRRRPWVVPQIQMKPISLLPIFCRSPTTAASAACVSPSNPAMRR
jgi:hypothetical protein